MPKQDRITLTAEDAMTVFAALRSSIRELDELLLDGAGEDFPSRSFIEKIRAEKWEVYQRIAKALRVKPTLDVVRRKSQ